MGVPHVVNTVHGLFAIPEDRLRRRVPVLAAEWIGARYSDLELYQSAEDLAWARRLHITSPGRLVLLGNGIDLSRYSPSLAGEERIPEAPRRAGDRRGRARGRDRRQDGPREGLRGVLPSRFRCAHAGPQRPVPGGGASDPDKPDSITAERIERAREDVVFTGWREDVADLMAVMDVFVLPSWREGLPRSAIEAAASGLPLVLTDIRGCREVIRDNVEGFLVPVRDPIRLAGAVCTLLEDPILRHRMGAAARRRAEERSTSDVW